VLLVFQLADRLAALPVENVERVTPMADLGRPPGLPSALEGVLDLAGAAVPVLRLDRLFGLPAQTVGLYSMLVILRGLPEQRLALLADRVTGILSIPEGGLLRIGEEDSFNGCAEATVMSGDRKVHVLSPSRMILAKERDVLSEFQVAAQQRLEECRASQV
jgi:purine-binding chemotaxis protein CheW